MLTYSEQLTVLKHLDQARLILLTACEDGSYDKLENAISKIHYRIGNLMVKENKVEVSK